MLEVENNDWRWQVHCLADRPGQQGNDGVAGLVSQNKGSAIGYVELVYAIGSKLPYATIRNSSGNFIVPSLASSGRAAQLLFPMISRSTS